MPTPTAMGVSVIFAMAGMSFTVMMMAATLARVRQTTCKVVIHDIHYLAMASADDSQPAFIQFIKGARPHIAGKHDRDSFFLENRSDTGLAAAPLG